MKLQRQAISVAVLLLLLTGSVYVMFTPNAYAEHAPEVKWTGCENPAGSKSRVISNQGVRMFTKYWDNPSVTPGWVTFNVSNPTGPDPITKVEVFIPQNQEGLCYFRLVQGKVTGNDTNPIEHQEIEPGWTMTIVEVDPRGWPRVIIFESESGIIGNDERYPPVLYFSLGLAKGPERPLACYYSFIVTTIDSDGRSKNMPPDGLELALDDTKPRVVDSTPKEGQTIEGIGEACGNHYFMLDVTADDKVGTCWDSGISRVIIKVGTPANFPPYDKNVAINPTYGNWKLSRDDPSFSRKVSNLPSGTNTLNVTIYDGVGNVLIELINFTYAIPPRPLTGSPLSGSASLFTYVKPEDEDTGLVTSNYTSYKAKEFGTLVTLRGMHVGDADWGQNARVRITIGIPDGLYPDYRYGSALLVALATTSNNATQNFTATFNFPALPAGTYRIEARSTMAGKTETGYCFVDFTVEPEIIYKPNEVIGPALINVEATGFPSVFDEGMPLYSLFMFCNNKDFLQGVNNQVFTNWFIDENGTLQNRFTFDSDRYTENGLYWPVMQPGEYKVALFLDHVCYKWNLGTEVRMEHFEHTNIVTVLDTLSLLPGIDGKLTTVSGDVATILTKVGYIEGNLTYLKPIIESINRTVVTISTTVGRIEAKIDDIQPRIVDIQSKVGDIQTRVVIIQTTVGQINGTVGVIKDDCVQIKTTVGDIWNKIKDVNFTKITTMAQEETSQDILSSVNTSALTIPIGAVLSAVAAIAAIIAAIVVVRRLKVAS